MKRYCPVCDREAETYVDTFMETQQVKGEKIESFSEVLICAECGEELWDTALDSENMLRAYGLYRQNHNLLQPEEIKFIREKYGISQACFSRLLGFGDKTITRYENGSIQDRAHNNMLLLMREYRNFEKLLDESIDIFSLDEKVRLRQRIFESQYREWTESEDVVKVEIKRQVKNVTHAIKDADASTMHDSNAMSAIALKGSGSMEKAKSTLQFTGYTVDSLYLERMAFDRENQKMDDEQHFEVAPMFRRAINDIDDSHYTVELAVRIEPSEEAGSLAYRAGVFLVGHFCYSGEKMINNATAILFPYLRSTLSMLTTSANDLPIFLPTMNIVRLFEEQEKKKPAKKKLPDKEQSGCIE